MRNELLSRVFLAATIWIFASPQEVVGFVSPTLSIRTKPQQPHHATKHQDTQLVRLSNHIRHRASRRQRISKLVRLQSQLDPPETGPGDSFPSLITSNISRAASFSLIMAFCGAALGPFLDSYHSAFGVLQYDQPITAALWGQMLALLLLRLGGFLSFLD
jgi:hypothetical protein